MSSDGYFTCTSNNPYAESRNHNFEPFYDTIEEEYFPMSIENLSVETINAIKLKRVTKKYIKSVCSHCGKEVK
jgi:hypothetical protein